MTKNKKKNITTEKNELAIIGIIISFLILVFKELISTYTFSVITLIPSIMVFIWFIINFFKKKISIKSYDVFFGIMLLIGSISGFINHQGIIAIIYQIKALSIFYLLFMVIRNIKMETEQVKKIIKFFNVITIILIVLAIIEVVCSKYVLFPSQWAKEIVYADNHIRAYSLICNPNVFAFYLLFILVFNYRFNKMDYSFKSNIFYSLIILGIILSISRSALICLIIISLVYIGKLIFDKKKKISIANPLKSLAIIIALAVCFSVTTYGLKTLYKNYINAGPNFGTTETPSTPNEGQEPSKPNFVVGETFLNRIASMFNINFLNDSLNNGRLAVVNYGFKVLEKNVYIGTGFSSFLTASSFLNPNLEAKELGLEYADNQYIAILVETGIVGIISCVVFMILFLKELIKNKKFESIIITFVLLFFGFFINVLEVQIIAFLYFLFIALDKERIHD